MQQLNQKTAKQQKQGPATQIIYMDANKHQHPKIMPPTSQTMIQQRPPKGPQPGVTIIMQYSSSCIVGIIEVLIKEILKPHNTIHGALAVLVIGTC